MFDAGKQHARIDIFVKLEKSRKKNDFIVKNVEYWFLF